MSLLSKVRVNAAPAAVERVVGSKPAVAARTGALTVRPAEPPDGAALSAADGATDGAIDGATDGAVDGATDGAPDGAPDAAPDPTGVADGAGA